MAQKAKHVSSGHADKVPECSFWKAFRRRRCDQACCTLAKCGQAFILCPPCQLCHWQPEGQSSGGTGQGGPVHWKIPHNTRRKATMKPSIMHRCRMRAARRSNARRRHRRVRRLAGSPLPAVHGRIVILDIMQLCTCGFHTTPHAYVQLVIGLDVQAVMQTTLYNVRYDPG